MRQRLWESFQLEERTPLRREEKTTGLRTGHCLMDEEGSRPLASRCTREMYESMGQEPPSPQSVSKLFTFPAPIKSACEQYLLYFGQFLSDLGIQTQTELAENAARVLFSVTPIDATQALSQIRDALAGCGKSREFCNGEAHSTSNDA